ncbi:MAG: hypothetical protein MI808_09470 [Pseudomonadales bacterium]|nr:hypothetical protein [Pseudomonadales bacterium]
MTRYCIAFLFMLLPQCLVAETEWQPEVESDDPQAVKTWIKKVSGASVNAFRGEVVVTHPPLEVLMVLDQPEAFPRWVFQCKGAQRVPGKGLYLQFRGIWPVSDRDAALVSTPSLAADRIVIHTVNQEDVMAEQPGYVRIPKLDNRFELIPLASGGTRIIFETFVDPGGIVPGFISNIVAKKGPLITLTGLKAELDSASEQTGSVDALSRIYDPIRTELRSFLLEASGQ